MRSTILNMVRDDEGATAIIVAVMLVVLLGLGAFTIDAGALYSERRSLQAAADAGALAGVQELPGSPSTAAGISNTYASRNVAEIGVTGASVTSQVLGSDRVECVVRDPARDLMFARFLNTDTAQVGARAIAAVQSPRSFSEGVMPFGIMSQEPSGSAPFGYVFGDTVTLKQPAQSGEAGNFQFLSLTDPPQGHVGWSDLRTALSGGGVPNPVYIDTLYNTKTGVNGRNVTSTLSSALDGHSFGDVCEVDESGFVTINDYECPNLIICPIIVAPGPPIEYSWNDINGSRPVLVIGFSYFFIDSVGTQGNECFVIGRFIRPLSPEEYVREWGPVDPFGAIGFRLVE